MKKSFKKAGAAVLSMAMLLSMGAMSMPVYAELDTHEKIVPTQVAVTIAKSDKVDHGGNSKGTGTPRKDDQGVQDDATHKYYYLDDVDEATVSMFRVATVVDGVGWQWVDPIKSVVEAANSGVESDFAKLLEKLDPDDLTSDPKMSSDDLQALAGLIQRTILTDQAQSSSTMTPVATQDIHKLNDGSFETVYLPNDEHVFDDAPATTKNIVGYYILITTTPDSGYVMQPVLVPISNYRYTADADANKRYVKKLSLKGTEISVDKDIMDIATFTDSTDKVAESFAEKDAAGEIVRESTGGVNIDSTKDYGVIDADDVIRYQIMADVPVYSKNATTMQYIISDTPDEGIDVISSDENGKYYRGAKESKLDAQNANPQIKVYYSPDTTLTSSGTGADILLDEWADYVVTPNDQDRYGKGFTITFTANRLRGYSTRNLSDPEDTTKSTKLNGQTMEGGHIFVVFNAVTNESFNSDWDKNTPLTPHAEEKDVEVADIASDILDSVKDGAISDELVASMSTLDSAKYTGTGVLDAVKTGLGITNATPTQAEQNKINTVLYLALSAKNRAIDDANELIKEGNANKNGTKNVASVKFDNDFTGTSNVDDYDEVEDTTKLFSARLDLTKVAIEYNVAPKTEDKVQYLAKTPDGTEVNGTDSGGTWTYDTSSVTTAKKTTDNKVVYFKANASHAEFSTYETTTNIDEAYVETTVSGATSRKVKVVTSWEATDVESNAMDDGATPTANRLYIKDGAEFTTTTVENEAKKVSTPVPDNYVDAYGHDKKVKGAVFKLEEDFEDVSSSQDGERLAGTDGDHVRSYAITNAQGKLMQLRVISNNVATKPAATDIKDVTEANAAANSTDIVYYVENPKANQNDPTTYTTFALTTAPAWDRIGEGTYKLTEVQAPTGYKKWGGSANLTITCDLTNEETIGKFTATSTSSSFWSTQGNAPADANTAATFVTPEGADKDGKLSNEILNEIDDTLPATGGIGTVLFTAGGISIVLIAGALFVMYMKKRNSEEEE